MTEDEWIPIKQAAEIKNVTPPSISAWVRSGHFPEDGIRRDGSGSVFVKVSALDQVVGYRRDPRFATGEFVKISEAAQVIGKSIATTRKLIADFCIPLEYAPNNRDSYLLRENAEELYEQVTRQRTDAEIEHLRKGWTLLEGPGGQDIIDQICQAVRAGYTISPAAAVAGIAPATLARWIREGRNREDMEVPESEDRFVQLVRGIDEALAQAEGMMIQKMTDAGDRDWGHWRYRLEKQHGWKEDQKAPSPVNVNVSQQVAQSQQVEQSQDVDVDNRTAVVGLSIADILKARPDLAPALSEIAEAVEGGMLDDEGE